MGHIWSLRAEIVSKKEGNRVGEKETEWKENKFSGVSPNQPLLLNK